MLPALSVSAASGFVAPQTSNAGRVTLLGTTDRGVSVTLVETSSIALANNTGGFQFNSVPLVLGDNTFTSVATDEAGNVRQTPTVIRRVESTAQQDPVLRWNQAILDAIQLDASTPTFASRAMAMVHAAIYDAVSAIEGTPGYSVTSRGADRHFARGSGQRRGASRPVVSLSCAASRCSTRCERRRSRKFRMAQQKRAAWRLGKRWARRIVALRADDGWDDFVDYVPGTNPGDWQQTEPLYAPAPRSAMGESPLVLRRRSR